MARSSYSYEKFLREKKKAAKKQERLDKKLARQAEKAGLTDKPASGEGGDADETEASKSDEQQPGSSEPTTDA